MLSAKISTPQKLFAQQLLPSEQSSIDKAVDRIPRSPPAASALQPVWKFSTHRPVAEPTLTNVFLGVDATGNLAEELAKDI